MAATPEQIREYREAEKQRYTQERYEQKPWTHRREEEDDVYHGFNDRAAAAAEPLSRRQEWRERNRAATEVDREFSRRQRESDRQDRERRQQRSRQGGDH